MRLLLTAKAIWDGQIGVCTVSANLVDMAQHIGRQAYLHGEFWWNNTGYNHDTVQQEFVLASLVVLQPVVQDIRRRGYGKAKEKQEEKTSFLFVSFDLFLRTLNHAH